jgi:hypothetical protein
VDDWPLILECALEQDVAPLLYFQLKQGGDEKLVPEQVLQTLQQAYHQNAARNLHLYHELHAVLELLTSLDLPVIILKGAFLASCVYPNPALRSMADIDILMHPEDIPVALEKLKELGYRLAVPLWANSLDYHLVLKAQNFIALLEIHWGLVVPNQHSSLPVKTLWENTNPVKIEENNTLTLRPEELLLHLCEHMAIKHVFRQCVRSLVDIDRIIRLYFDNFDWEKTILFAKAWGLQKAVLLSLFFCRKYLSTPVPEFVFDALDIVKIEPIIFEEALAEMFISSESTDGMPLGWFRAVGEKKLIERGKILFKYLFILPRIPYQSQYEHNQILRSYFVFQRLIYYIKRYHTSLWQGLFRKHINAGNSDSESILLRWLQS